MKNTVTLILGILLISIVSACNYKDYSAFEGTYSFLNGNFETGNLSGWERHGDAFTNDHVTFELKDEYQLNFYQEGYFFYYGGQFQGKGQGYMISESFIIKGNGVIGFLMGAGQNPELTYVSVIDAAGKELAKTGNTKFNNSNELHRLTLDLSDYIGTKVKIKVVDEDTSDGPFNYINVDDFIINYKGSNDEMTKLKEANLYVENNKHTMNQRYRHTYHAMSQFNWGNDPNGLIWYQNQFHLFYQHNPYASKWGPMHWGHQTTKDFIKWEHQPIALAPDKPYDADLGAFSGTAIEIDNQLYLMYTSAANNLQEQSYAVSKDGYVFEKYHGNPVIRKEDNPIGANASEIRDPKIFRHGNYFYVILGTIIGGKGQLVLYRTIDLVNYTYVGPLFNTTNPARNDYFSLPGVFECPDFIIIDGKHVLISSPQFLTQRGTEFENIHSVIYMVGTLNFETGKFEYESYHELDGGFDFYAAQSAKLPDGRTIMMAWMQMWDRALPTEKDNWAGAYTLPRELSLKGDHLIQTPITEIANYRTKHVQYKNISLISGAPIKLEGIEGNAIELEVVLDLGDADKVGLSVLKGTTNETLIYYDRTLNQVIFDRSQSGTTINGREENIKTRSVSLDMSANTLKLRIFIDISSVEVFINDGMYTLTSNVYPNPNDLNIEFFSLGGQSQILSVDKYSIEVA